MFGLRPPELVSVFQNPKYYYRLCIIGRPISNPERLKEWLSPNLKVCFWIDCIGRQVRLRENGLREMMELLVANEADTGYTDDIDDFPIYDAIRYMITVHDADEESLSEQDSLWKVTYLHEFIVDDGLELLPIPVPSPVGPRNAHSFFIHIILSLGKYTTEIDVLRHPSARTCLQKAKLIGTDIDANSLQLYVDKLLMNYIVNQVVYYPNSLRATAGFIEMADKLFSDIIIRDEFTANEIPFTVTDMLNEAEEHQIRIWNEITESQLISIYKTLGAIPHIPSRVEVASATRTGPHYWDPTSLQRSPNQNAASHEEQMIAIKTNKYSIDKYCGVHIDGGLTYTKNVITHGAPVSGKSHVAQVSVLYAIS